MNRRQLMGWVAVLAGIITIIFAVHSNHQFEKSKTKTRSIKLFFTHNPLWNPIIKFFGGKPQEKLPEHNEHAMITQNIGIVLVVVGGAAVYLFRRKKRN